MHEGDDVFAPAQVRSANVLVNGQPQAWRPGMTVADVLSGRSSDDDFVATAVNTRFVPRSARVDTPLWPDDRVVVFSAIVGG